MRSLKLFIIGAIGFSASAVNAADTIKWLHVEVNLKQVAIWKEAARAFEAKHPGVKVEPQYLENEAYKAKLPRCCSPATSQHIIYSWAGGVLKAQVEAGVIEDLTDHEGLFRNAAPSAVAAFTIDGKIYGVPRRYRGGLLLQQGAVRQGRRRCQQDQDLGRPARRREGAEGRRHHADHGRRRRKWPVSFYWSYLSLRQGGKPASRRR